MVAARKQSDPAFVIINGQVAFGFYERHRKSISEAQERRRRDRMLLVAQRQAERRGDLKHLLELSDLPESHLSADELARLDNYVWKVAAQEIKDKWTPEEAADREGKDMRKSAKTFLHDGRYFQAETMTVREASGFSEIGETIISSFDY